MSQTISQAGKNRVGELEFRKVQSVSSSRRWPWSRYSHPPYCTIYDANDRVQRSEFSAFARYELRPQADYDEEQGKQGRHTLKPEW
jgi:hypothetical protein